MARVGPVLLVGAGLVLGACRTLAEIAPPVTAAMTGEEGRLQEGRRLYLQRCASCHSLEAVDAYSAAEWERILPGMAKKSKLRPEQGAALRDYLLSARDWKLAQPPS